jgi:tRNA-2-methylthio-N6-dimethylallyladenosine synthase
VLFEGESKAGAGRVTGRTERNEIVHVASDDPSLIGEIAEVRIVRAFKHSLEGELVSGPRERRPRAEAARRALPVVAS